MCLCELDWPQWDNRGVVEVNDTAAKKLKSAFFPFLLFSSFPARKKKKLNGTREKHKRANGRQTRHSASGRSVSVSQCKGVSPGRGRAAGQTDHQSAGPGSCLGIESRCFSVFTAPPKTSCICSSKPGRRAG